MKTKRLFCGERVQRLVMSIFILIVLMLLAKGMSLAALILLAFMSIMLFIYFAFDFCPSTWILTKILGSCYCECKGEKNENQL